MTDWLDSRAPTTVEVMLNLLKNSYGRVDPAMLEWFVSQAYSDAGEFRCVRVLSVPI